MKTLFIIRHAKSDWSDGSLHDRERPLNERGLRDAPLMAGAFVQRAGVPELFLSSPAVRAYTTCQYFCAAAGVPVSAIRIEEQFYFGSPEAIVRILQGHFRHQDSVAIFGHNPTSSNLAYLLCPDFLDDMPTCAIVALGFEGEVKAGKGKLLWYDYPKKHR